MISKYKKNGFIVEKVFSDKEIKAFEKTFVQICKMQMKKINIKINSNNIQTIAKKLWKKNSQALEECCLMSRNTKEGHELAGNKKILEISKILLNSKSPLIVSGPSFFVNFPKSSEKKYTWHSEQNWYPKRRNFLNIWCPIFEDRVKKNSMAIKEGSHKSDWFYFSEYKGYNGKKDDTSNVQYEIPNNLVKKFKTIFPNVKKNDGIFFNGKSVHSSIDNNSKKVFFTLVFRVYDYQNDLTLSSNWADIPYNQKSLGHPNINVE